MAIKKMSRLQVRFKVENARRDKNVIVDMLEKNRDKTAQNFNHGHLHIDFDDREGTNYNNDLLRAMPFKLTHPVMITSYKGCDYAHCRDDEVMDLSNLSTGDILTEIIMKHGEENDKQ